MRLPVALTLAVAVLGLMAPSILFAAPLAPPFDVYDAGPLDDASLARVRENLGPWQVIHRERRDARTWVLLALPDDATGGDLPGWGRPRYLGRVRAGERIVYLGPEAPARGRLGAGRPLTIAPSGGTVFVTSTRPDRIAPRAHHAFRILERTAPLAAPGAPGPSPAFRPILERGSRTRTGRGASRTVADVQELIARVSPDSLESYVRTLAERETGEPTSRYFSDPRTEGIHRAYIQDRFSEILGLGMVSNHAFGIENTDGDTVTVHNVVGRLPSVRPGAGAFLMTAHYDAIGSRSDPLDLCAAGLRPPASGCDCNATEAELLADVDCAWNWETDPAPGADDNATGVATLIEAARLLSSLSFDFDIYFVAFQGEELGLLGSAAFADSVVLADQEIYGVLNLDMLGYNALRNECDVITNESSEWLADFLIETAQLFVPDLPVEKFVQFFGRSDHASFWSVGIDAVLLFEDIELPYPGYHTFQDTWEMTFPAAGRPNSELQFELAAELVIATLARFAIHHEAPDLAIPAGEVEVRPATGIDFEAGRTLLLTARVHNFGPDSLSFQGSTTDSLTARVSFYDGDPDEGASLLAQSERRDFFPGGGVVEFTVPWATNPGQEGFHEIHAVVEGLDPGYERSEPSSANNRSSTTFFLKAPGGSEPALLMHYPYPNPLRGTEQALQLYFELTRDASVVTIEVFDLEGERVGNFRATSQFTGNGNQAGPNRVTGNRFRWQGSGLDSGVYLYSIRCFGTDGFLTDVGEGKFAIVR